jgi:copper(I)-binding protein
MNLVRGLAAVGLVAIGALAGAAADAPALRWEDTWIRDAPPSAMMRSAYGRLLNDSDAAVEVIAAASPDYGLVEVHETRIENDVARMVQLPSVTVPARGAFDFVPGGAHLMLMRPKRRLATGERTMITVTLKSGETVTASFVVGQAL